MHMESIETMLMGKFAKVSKPKGVHYLNFSMKDCGKYISGSSDYQKKSNSGWHLKILGINLPEIKSNDE